MNPYSIWQGDILVLDFETDNREHLGRFASQFHPDNYVVAMGYSYNGNTPMHTYYNCKEEVPKALLPDLSTVKLIVGHNIKYDLLWCWDDPNLTAFFERGGEIYDTQYGEYLLGGMVDELHMNSMEETAPKYGGGEKYDAVKEMWNSGMLTSDIPRDMLVEYLIGSAAVNNPYGGVKGDIMNTWLMFVGQCARFDKMHHNFVPMLRGRHDGLLGLCEMEWNGIMCDREVGAQQRVRVQQEVESKLAELNSHLPELPPEFEFNWGSPAHKSALLFGGTVSYQKWMPHLDENGDMIYPMKVIKCPLFRGKPIHPDITLCINERHYLPVPVDVPQTFQADVTMPNGHRYLIQDVVKTGKSAGSPKFLNVKEPNLDKPKGKKQDFYVTFKGYVKPDKRWATANEDAFGNPLYSTGDKIIKKLKIDGTVPFLDAFTKYAKAKKDMETYYWKEDEEGNPVGGMLTLVGSDGIIHHSLNNTSTVTARLSSSNPNGQNLPRGSVKDGKVKGSEAKRMFRSRWGDEGEMGEIDYSQLEVVCLGVLTGDKQLIADLNNGVDFHIKRLSAKLKRPYEELWKLHHVDGDPDIDAERTKAKVYSFQSQYGAGLATIAYDTGMSLEEVKALAEADEQLYPGVKPFYEQLNYIRETNSYQTGEYLYIEGDRYPIRRGYWDSPTGTRYMWTQQEAPDFLKDRGTFLSFSPTELKNYPSQGLGGEVMQVMLGKVWRYFIANKRFNGLVKMVNTVHDCLWLDGHKSLLRQVTCQVARILECVPQVFKSTYNIDVPVPFPVEAKVGANMLELSVIHH